MYNILYDEAVNLAEQFDIPPSKPRTTGRQQNRANPAISDIRDYWLVTMYYAFLDHLLSESIEIERSIGKL